MTDLKNGMELYQKAKEVKKELEWEHKEYLGKIFKWKNLLVVPFEVPLPKPSNPLPLGIKAIIIRSEENGYEVGHFITVPFEVLPTLEQFPSVLLWGFAQ